MQSFYNCRRIAAIPLCAALALFLPLRAVADAALPGGIALYSPSLHGPGPDWWTNFGATNGFPSASTPAQIWQLRQFAAAVCDHLDDVTDGHFGRHYPGNFTEQAVLGSLADPAYNILADTNSVPLGLMKDVWGELADIFRRYAFPPDSLTSAELLEMDSATAEDGYDTLSGQLLHLFLLEIDGEIAWQGLPDWWSCFHLVVDPDADDDGDGLSSREEFTLWTDPDVADTDGDGVGDGLDPDPVSFDTWSDLDADGIPDIVEVSIAGALAPLESLGQALPGGWTVGAVAATGNTNLLHAAAPEVTEEAPGLLSAMLAPEMPFLPPSSLLPVGATLREWTFEVRRHRSFEQYYILFGPYSAPTGRLAVSWSDSGGASGSVSCSPENPVWMRRLPVSAGCSTLTVSLDMASSGVAMPVPPRLLAFAPPLSIDDAVGGNSGGVACHGILAGENAGEIVADMTDSPFSVPPVSNDPVGWTLPFDPGVPVTADTTYGLRFILDLPPGIFPLGVEPHLSPTNTPAPGGAAFPGLPADATSAIIAFDPTLSYIGSHRRETQSLLYDPVSNRFGRIKTDYPLDTPALWRAFHSSTNGWPCAECTATFSTGIAEALPDCVETSVTENDRFATASIHVGGELLWEDTAVHDIVEDLGESPFEPECGGGCVSCADLEGPSLGCLRFRIPLGSPREGQVSGFVWCSVDSLDGAPSPGLFQVLAREDANVADSWDAQGRTVACADDRGRTVRLVDVFDEGHPVGVQAMVTETASGLPDHVWEIRLHDVGAWRFTRTSRLGNVQSDEVFSQDGDDWRREDLVSGAVETVSIDNRLHEAPGVLDETREIRDADGRLLSRTETRLRREGWGAGAVLHEDRRATLAVAADGSLCTNVAFATFDGIASRPRLVAGDDRPWSYSDYDSRGRPVLRLDQLDGSPVPNPVYLYDAGFLPWDTSFTMETLGYEPLAGDTGDAFDDAIPRTVSRFVVHAGGQPLCTAREWTVVVRETSGGLPVVRTRLERAHSSAALRGDAANAVSESVAVAADAPDVPLALRGAPVSETDEDGVTTHTAYDFGAWNPATRSFDTAAPGEPTHLRAVSWRSTAAAPGGIARVSTGTLSVRDAVHGNEVFSAAILLTAAAPTNGSPWLASDGFFDLLDWEARSYDDQDRLRSVLHSDGSSETNAYSCCRLLWSEGRDGRKTLRSAKTGTDHLYWADEEISLAELPRLPAEDFPVEGWPTGLYRVTQHFRDALGRETNAVTRLGDSPGQATNAVFQSNAFWTSSSLTLYPFGPSDFSACRDARGNWRYRWSGGDQTSSSSKSWLDATDGIRHERTDSFRNGRTVSLRDEDGPWVRTTSFHDYDADGCRVDVSVTETSDGDCFTNSVSFSDFLGRTERVATPLSDTAYAFDGVSSRVLSSTNALSGLSSVTLYDALLQPVGEEVNDIATWSDTHYECDASNAWWRVTESREAAEGATNFLSSVRERITGLSNDLRSETVAVDARGVEVRTVASYDPATKILVETTTSPVSASVVRKTMFGREIERTEDGEVVRTYYDPFGRPCATARIGVESGTPYTRFGDILGRNALGDVVSRRSPVSPADSVCVSTTFDSLGRPVLENTVADETTSRHLAHDLSGRLTGENGDSVFPTRQSYDALGHRVSLSTTRDGALWDVTRWGWDAATGLCTNKAYADGSRVRYVHDAVGRPVRTTLASGRWTQSAYDSAGRLASTTNSGGRVVEFSYDAFGRLASVSDSAGLPAVTANPGGRAATSSRTAFGRLFALSDADGADGPFSRAAFGRLRAASNSVGIVEMFARDALAAATNETQVIYDDFFLYDRSSSLDRRLDAFGRPAGHSLAVDGGFAHAVAYAYDADGRVASLSATNAQGRSVSVEYDWHHGRLAGWTVRDASNAVLFAQSLARDGWRPWLVTNCVAGGAAAGSPVRSFAYAFDLLGRPVGRNADAFGYDARGEVTNATLSAVPYLYAYDGIGNRTSTSAGVVATAYAANELNQYTAVGSAVPTYDADGNLTTDGDVSDPDVFYYSWDADGRLSWTMNGHSDCDYRYDRQGRRTRILTARETGPGWNIADVRLFDYDGWNLVHETRFALPNLFDIDYFWGPDLSGTLQGAGGVGGLVAVSVNEDFYFPGYDNNGNVVGYWDESGALVAEYAYDAFGNTLSATGPMVGFFPHRFSTKYFDDDTGLYYYGYRYYSPRMGRWISRDPIEEGGGENLYSFCNNSPLLHFDTLGLASILWPVPPPSFVPFPFGEEPPNLISMFPQIPQYPPGTPMIGPARIPLEPPKRPCYSTFINWSFDEDKYFSALTKTTFSLLVAAQIAPYGGIESAEIPIPWLSVTDFMPYRTGLSGMRPNVPCTIKYSCTATCRPCSGCPSSRDEKKEVFQKTFHGSTFSRMQPLALQIGTPSTLRFLGYKDQDIWEDGECRVSYIILEKARLECKRKAESSCTPRPKPKHQPES